MNQSTVDKAPASAPRRRISRVVWITAIGWVAISIIAVILAGDTLPFDRPALADTSVVAQVIAGTGGLLGVGLLIGITYLMTRHRVVPDIATRAPQRRQSIREVSLVIGYVVIAQAVGFALGHAIGTHAISLHLPGAVYGTSNPVTEGWALAWAGYNFVVYAVVPYLYFRQRGYSNEQLNLRSADRRADFKLIVTILLIEAGVELAVLGKPLFALAPGQAAKAVGLSFAINFVGTVLPVAILIYSILLPRIHRITGSTPGTVIVGGLAYTFIHFYDGWTNYSTVTTGSLSMIFLVLQYFGPGMIKSVLTLRTGNAWVHVWAYHAIAPHATIDAPTVVKPFHVH